MDLGIWHLTRRRHKSPSVKVELSSHKGQYGSDSEDGFEENSSFEVVHLIFKLLSDVVEVRKEKIKQNYLKMKVVCAPMKGSAKAFYSLNEKTVEKGLKPADRKENLNKLRIMCAILGLVEPCSITGLIETCSVVGLTEAIVTCLATGLTEPYSVMGLATNLTVPAQSGEILLPSGS